MYVKMDLVCVENASCFGITAKVLLELKANRLRGRGLNPFRTLKGARAHTNQYEDKAYLHSLRYKGHCTYEVSLFSLILSDMYPDSF